MAKPKLIIFGDPRRRHAADAVKRFVEFVDDKAEIFANCFREDCPTADILSQADFAVVFGGDGTILSAARTLCQTDVPVIGVNVGKLGFLAEFGIEELQRHFDRITKDKGLIEKRMILDCRVERNAEEMFALTAINDVVISAGAPFSMIELKMAVDNQTLTAGRSDGVIVSTPTGSTAYNISAGGPILAAHLSAIVITPLSPHSLSFRPIVISADSTIDIQAVTVNEGTTITLDGQVAGGLKVGDVVKIHRHSGTFLVVNNPERTLWDTLAGKLNWAEKPRYSDNEN